MCWCNIWKDSVCWLSSRGSKFSRQVKMPLLSPVLTRGLRGALYYTATRSSSSGTLHITDPLNFWCGSRVNLKDVKAKSEPVYEPATGNVFPTLTFFISPHRYWSIRLCPITWSQSHLAMPPHWFFLIQRDLWIKTLPYLILLCFDEYIAGRVLCQLQACGATEVDAAVRSAGAAFTVWSKLAGMERARVMIEAARLIEVDRNALIRLHKTLQNSAALIQEVLSLVFLVISTVEYRREERRLLRWR